MKIILFYKQITQIAGAEILLIETYKKISKHNDCEIIVFDYNKEIVDKSLKIKKVGNTFGLFLYLLTIKQPIIIGSSGHINLFIACIFQNKKYSYHIHQPSIFSYNEYDKYAFKNILKLKNLFVDNKKYLDFLNIYKSLNLLQRIKINIRFILSKLSYKFAKKTFVLSYLAQEEKKILYDIDSNILRGAVNLINYNELIINQKNNFDTKINLITVGRLVYDKRVDLIIKAIYKSQNNNLRYHIYGEGPEFIKLKNLIKSLNLESSVFMHNYLTESKKYLKIIKSDYFVSIGAADYNIATIESLLCKTPVILSNDSPYEDTISNSGAVYYINQNLDELSVFLKNLNKNDIEHVNWNKLHNYINENLSWNTFTNKLLKLVKND